MRAGGRVIAVAVGDGQHSTLQQPQLQHSVTAPAPGDGGAPPDTIQCNPHKYNSIYIFILNILIQQYFTVWWVAGRRPAVCTKCTVLATSRCQSCLYHGLTRPRHGADMGQARDSTGLPDTDLTWASPGITGDYQTMVSDFLTVCFLCKFTEF